MKNIIETKNLSVGYGRKDKALFVLENINLKANKGELITVLGVNGSGKSTLIRTMAGLQPALKGEIIIEIPIKSSITKLKQGIKTSVVLTNNETTGLIKVEEMVALGRHPHTNWLATLNESDSEEIANAMELTSITHLKEKFFHELSDGQKQKTVIARAIAQDTPVIFLDEPTNHLDIGNKLEIMKLLQKLSRKRGKTIIMTTHDIQLATQMSDRMWLIDEGKVITGIPEEHLLYERLEKIFNTINYNLNTGEIIINATKSAEFCVSGDHWGSEITKKALKRIGFAISEKRKGAIEIIVEKSDSGFYWRLNDTEYSSLENLLKEASRL